MLDRQLQHVVAVARTGSFTKAGELVGVTQSGITRSIADLEREIGYALFYRSARGALLTEQGRDFAERAGQLLEDARILVTGSGEKADPYARTLRIGVCPSSLEWRLAEPLVDLLQRHPAVRIEVVGSSLERLVQLLRSGGVDVAVGFEEAFSEWSDIKTEHVSSMRTLLFVRKSHPILARRAVTAADLTSFDCVLPSSRPFGNVLRELYEAQGVSWQRHLHIIDNLHVAMRLVATSDAFALTSEDVAQSAIFARTFEQVPVESLFPFFPLCCAVRSRWELPRPVTAFLQTMKNVPPQRYDAVA